MVARILFPTDDNWERAGSPDRSYPELSEGSSKVCRTTQKRRAKRSRVVEELASKTIIVGRSEIKRRATLESKASASHNTVQHPVKRQKTQSVHQESDEKATGTSTKKFDNKELGRTPRSVDKESEASETRKRKTREGGSKKGSIVFDAKAQNDVSRDITGRKNPTERERQQEASTAITPPRKVELRKNCIGETCFRSSTEQSIKKHEEKKIPSLLSIMATRLSGSRFRFSIMHHHSQGDSWWLNESLYTSTGEEALELMQQQPELFHQYHQGYQEQTKSWPQQPVQVAIRWLKTLPASLQVADFGCGEAKLAKSVKQKVASLDLVATVPGVIAGNMGSTPLGSGTVDVAVFCLALMGTDYFKFLEEAHRVLKVGGWLWIAEVRSRFANTAGEDFGPLLLALQASGFKLVTQDVSSKMFVIFRLKKQDSRSASPNIAWPELNPCRYKKR